MKLSNKVLVSNIILSVFILAASSIGMYFLIYKTVYDELDNHLLQHKIDIINQLQDDPSSIKAIKKMGSLGSYEWIDVQPYDGAVKPQGNRFATIDTARHSEQIGKERYRRLTTAISVNDQYYTLRVYEEVAAWNSIGMTILLSVLAGILIWILLLYLLNQIIFDRILTPFYDTVNSLEGISDPSDLEGSFPHSSTYEINVLNQALNSMMREIRSSFEDQKKFIQNASHELLTPLSIIRQKSERTLAKAEQLDQGTIKAVHDIQQTAVRLSRLSNALLLISRVENKQYNLDEQVTIAKVTRSVLDELKDFVEMKDLTISTDLDSNLSVRGNKELIHSVIYNIVQNAVKFSPESGTVQIVAKKDDTDRYFSVTDEGPGIPPDLLDSVFDRFKKGQNSLDGIDGDSSPGLGLSIVHSICRLHKFECRAQNIEGDGAKITILF